MHRSQSVDVGRLQKGAVSHVKKQEHGIPEEVVKENLPMVEALASAIFSRSALPQGVEFGDLVSWGVEGLIKGYKNYQLGKGTKFSTYAYYRVRGEILDNIRIEWQYRNPNHYSEYRREIQRRIADFAEASINNTKEMTEKQCAQYITELIGDSAMVGLLSLDVVGEVDIEKIVSENQQRDDLVLVSEELKALDEDEQQVIELMYMKGFKQKEIAESLKCSRSSVSRLHSTALRKLRLRLRWRLNSE